MTMSPALIKYLHTNTQARKARVVADRFADKADDLSDQAGALYFNLTPDDKEEVGRRTQFRNAIFMIRGRAKRLMELQKAQNPIWRIDHSSPVFDEKAVKFLTEHSELMLRLNSPRYPQARAAQISRYLDALRTLKGKPPCHGTKDPHGALTQVLKELKLELPSLLPA